MLRILLAIFLLIPLPVLAEEVPGEVTVNEAFDDSTYETGLTISGGNQDAFIYCNEQDTYGTTTWKDHIAQVKADNPKPS